MPNFKNSKETVDRLRIATASLSDPRDISVAQQYLEELQAVAAEQDRQSAGPKVMPLAGGSRILGAQRKVTSGVS